MRQCEYYVALNTLVQCVFHSYSKPEGALGQKAKTRLIEVITYDVPGNPNMDKGPVPNGTLHGHL